MGEVTNTGPAAIEQARIEAINALLRAGEAVIANLDGATPDSRAEADRLMKESRFRGIVLNELLAEEGDDD